MRNVNLEHDTLHSWFRFVQCMNGRSLATPPWQPQMSSSMEAQSRVLILEDLPLDPREFFKNKKRCLPFLHKSVETLLQGPSQKNSQQIEGKHEVKAVLPHPSVAVVEWFSW